MSAEKVKLKIDEEDLLEDAMVYYKAEEFKVLYECCGSWPQKCYDDGCSTGWLRRFIATRRYEFFNFRSADARDGTRSM